MLDPAKRLAARKLAHVVSTRKSALWTVNRTRLQIEDDYRCVSSLVGVGGGEAVAQYVNEIRASDVLRERLESYSAVTGKNLEDELAGRAFSSALYCYVALRFLRPATVIETACPTGWMSSLILYALHLNDAGHLHSIELPAVEGELSMGWSLPEDLPPGFPVPDSRRDRWTLHIGDVRDRLLPLLSQTGPVDVFFHDSDHTYDHMMWEFTSAWPYLSSGGLLISDDIRFNPAFWDFSLAMGRDLVIHARNPNLGAIRK